MPLALENQPRGLEIITVVIDQIGLGEGDFIDIGVPEDYARAQLQFAGRS